jgi:hypothetical protein
MLNVSYPCPYCQAPASLATGCPGCGRGPDPDAAEVVRLNHELATLTVALEQARQTYADLSARHSAVHRQREEAAGRVRAAAYVAHPPAPVAHPGPARPETSPRTAQNVLFALGGILVGAAAIVFTGVAFVTYGVETRAVILAVVTALLLAVPPLAARRGLRSTAETFAALGMLLIVLDGYAAWYSDLFGIRALDGAGYAALICAVTAAVGVGYGRLTGLHAPRLAALVAAQPVLPLVADWVDAWLAGWALAFAGTAAIDLVLIRFGGLATRVLGWVGFGCAQVASGVCALLVFVGDGTPVPLTGLPVLLVALLLAAAGPVGRVGWLSVVGAAAVPPAVAIAVLRPVAEQHGSVLPVVAGATVLAIALAALRLPVARFGALLTAGLAGLAFALTAAIVGVSTMVGSLPAFTADGIGARDLPLDWQLPAALLLGTAALALLVPKAGRAATLTGGGLLTVLALPTWLALPWWAVSAIGLAVAAALLLALRPAREPTLAAALLAGHALVVSLARPWSAAAALGAFALLGLAASARARQGAAWWCGAGLAAVPGAVAATVYAAGAGGAWPARAGLAAVAVPLVATLLFARLPRLRGYAPAAATALASCAVVAGTWPALEVEEPAGVYPSLALLMLAVAALGLRGNVRLALWLAGIPLAALAAVVAALPAAVLLLLAPYTWWERPWEGVPPGVGLTSSELTDFVDITAGQAATLLILAAVCVAGSLRTLRPISATGATGAARAARGAATGTGTAAEAGAAAETGAGEPEPGATEPASEATPHGQPGADPPAAIEHPPYPDAAAPGRGRTTLPGWRVGNGLLAMLAGFLGVCGLLAVLVAADVPWPVVPVLALTAGIGFGIAAAVRPTARAGGVAALLLAGPGVSGLLPTETSTLAAFGALIAAGAVAGAAGGAVAARVTGWLAALAAGSAFAVAAVLAADLPLRRASFPVLAVGAVALALGYLLRRRRPGLEGPAVDALGHVAVLPALLLAWGDVSMAAGVATAWGALLGVRAVLPGERARLPLAFAAGGSELLAWWLLLVNWEVALREAYTLPAAALALGAGYVTLRRNPRLGSWLALGPGLAAALLPSLAAVLVAGGQVERRLLLGAGAVLIVLVGAHRRWQAPVVAGGLTLVVLTIHELAVWDVLPRWAYLAGGGLVLIAVAMTYERRLRDLRRVRGALGRMT